MKKIMVFVIAGMFLFAPLVNAANAPSPGPAPSAGDGESEGSEWGGLGDMLCDVFPDLCQGVGPAPNAGDGVPDGSGF
ncbi:MAG: hypothetical protein A2Y79_01435 [Deltaproteobacteria bacterium RBG_13_43_22]|nr:MAG: hypothetical protein A2Y79_01435 [Deltaproteobacteria bacterium RBG_13_43_22]